MHEFISDVMLIDYVLWVNTCRRGLYSVYKIIFWFGSWWLPSLIFQKKPCETDLFIFRAGIKYTCAYFLSLKLFNVWPIMLILSLLETEFGCNGVSELEVVQTAAITSEGFVTH